MEIKCEIITRSSFMILFLVTASLYLYDVYSFNPSYIIRGVPKAITRLFSIVFCNEKIFSISSTTLKPIFQNNSN